MPRRSKKLSGPIATVLSGIGAMTKYAAWDRWPKIARRQKLDSGATVLFTSQ